MPFPGDYLSGSMTGTSHPRVRRQGLALLLGGVIFAAGGCTSSESARAVPGQLRGPQLTQPIPKPDFTLITMEGNPFHFREATRGTLTLLFFGYTHCPDVCPLHMANIAAVLKKLPLAVTERVRVVFVTTDPERDTPERLREWLGGFDPRFIGLTGSPAAIALAQTAARVAPAFRDTTTAAPPGEYYLGHAAQVIAYTPDGYAHAMYPWGIRQEDWANDLPLLLARWPGP